MRTRLVNELEAMNSFGLLSTDFQLGSLAELIHQLVQLGGGQETDFRPLIAEIAD